MDARCRLGSFDAARPVAHALFEQSATGIAVVDLEGRYLAVNQALCRLIGRSEAELLRLSWQDVTHPDDVGAGEELMAAIERGDASEARLEKRYVLPDGELRWAVLGSAPLADADGRPVGFLSQVVDITAAKQGEAALRAEQGLLELLTAVSIAVNESATAEHAFRVAVNAVCAHTGWPVGHAVRVADDRLSSAGVWVTAEPAAARALQEALADRGADVPGAAAGAARSRRPAWADLAREPAGDAWRAAGASAVGAWPVIAGGELLAVLEFGADEPSAPPEALGNVLVSVCSQVAQALDRGDTLERLRASEAQLSEAQVVAGLGSWRWDLDTDEVAWSEQTFRILGRKPHSVAPSVAWFMAHVHEDDRERIHEQLAHALATGDRLDVETRIMAADGRTRSVIVGGEVAAYAGGRPRHLVGYVQDVTARAEALEALTRSEERVRLILQTSTDAFVAYDRDFVVAQWNRAAEELFGWSRAEAVGRRVHDLIVPRGPAGEELVTILAALDSPALDTAVETSIRRRDGALVPVEVTIPRTPDEVLRSTFVRDISERKRAERALQEANATLRKSVLALEQRSREVTILSDMVDLLQSGSEVAEGYRVIARYAEQLFPDTGGALYVEDEADELFVAVTGWAGYEPLEPTLVVGDCWALRRRRLHRADPGGTPLYCPHARNERARTLCVPMIVQGEIVGLVHLRAEGPEADIPSVGHDLLLTDFAERTGLALANMRLRDRLRTQSIRDGLTGLFNRRYLEETFERELSRAQRDHSPLGVAMLDLDHFKQFNDRFGHQLGDVALQLLATHLRESVRVEDVACRYGGEEFLILFPDATLDQVRARCDALRKGNEALPLEPEVGSWHTTVSVGVAAFPQHGDDIATLLRAADAALYAAKRAGRDRVVVAEAVIRA